MVYPSNRCEKAITSRNNENQLLIGYRNVDARLGQLIDTCVFPDLINDWNYACASMSKLLSDRGPFPQLFTVDWVVLRLFLTLSSMILLRRVVSLHLFYMGSFYCMMRMLRVFTLALKRAYSWFGNWHSRGISCLLFSCIARKQQKSPDVPWLEKWPWLSMLLYL